ncbi:MAG TPA: SagB family peptide dehydrogenase [Longimicrobium sp.]
MNTRSQSPGRGEAALLLSFRPGITVEEDSLGRLSLVDARGGAEHLADPSPVLREVVSRLGHGATEAEVAAAAEATGDPLALPTAYFQLDQWRARGVLAEAIEDHGAVLATAIPIREGWRHAGPLPPPAGTVLSRFALFYRDGGATILESPLANCRLLLNGRVAGGLLSAFGETWAADALAAACGVSRGAAALLADLLWRCGFTVPAGVEDPQLATWELPDLLLHARSRGRGRRGGTYRFAGTLEPPPVTRPRHPGDPIPLHRPGTPANGGGPSFADTLERRRTVRVHDGLITAAQIGELLFRAARVKSIMPSRADPAFDTSRRPYPSGGACYPLELYLTVGTCDGLASGLYHYEPLEHELTRLAAPSDQLREMLHAAGAATGRALQPQLLVTLTARFARTSWKYEGTAYALILTEAGALLQTLYLVATAMDLAPCALGTGDADAFAEVSGLPYLTEGAVGECLLGACAPQILQAER